MHALLELDCIPSGMELFPAANETQWDLIKRVIDECDYYILILGGRYGSIGPDGISYTEMEYRYALSIDKPIIAFVHKEPQKIPLGKSESDDVGKAKLAEFRAFVGKRLWKEWSSPADLGSVVSRSLIQLIKKSPAVGWVRANSLADKDAALELLRLKEQVEDLEKQLARTRMSAPKGAERFAQGDDLFLIHVDFKAGESAWGKVDCFQEFELSWNEIFAAVAPLMIDEVSENGLKMALDAMVKERNIDAIRNSEEFKDDDYIDDFHISINDYQTIKVQLRALGLIAKSEKNRSVKDRGTYWTLTPYGDEVMTRLRAITKTDETGSIA